MDNPRTAGASMTQLSGCVKQGASAISRTLCAYFLNLRYIFYSFLPYRELDLTRPAIQTLALLNVTMLGMTFVLLLYLVRRPRPQSGRMIGERT
ncbi:MAG: hypothetical protein ACRDG4_03580 [Chloroflexota bacterium]